VVQYFPDQVETFSAPRQPRSDRPPEEFEHAVAPIDPSGAATLTFFQPAEGADFEGMKRARKNNRPTRVCSFSCLNEGVHPNALC